MIGNVYNPRLRTTRLASNVLGVWLVAVVRQVRQDGVRQDSCFAKYAWLNGFERLFFL